jgi:hypothetical protein
MTSDDPRLALNCPKCPRPLAYIASSGAIHNLGEPFLNPDCTQTVSS